MAHNVCLNLIRSSRRPETPAAGLTSKEVQWLENQSAESAALLQSGPAPNPERDVIVSDLAEKVLALLEPEDRLILLLLDGEGMSSREIADQTGWSVSRIKVRAFRARKKLRKEVQALMAPKEIRK